MSYGAFRPIISSSMNDMQELVSDFADIGRMMAELCISFVEEPEYIFLCKTIMVLKAPIQLGV